MHTLSILDLTGFTYSMFNAATRGLVQGAAKIGQDYYPE